MKTLPPRDGAASRHGHPLRATIAVLLAVPFLACPGPRPSPSATPPAATRAGNPLNVLLLTIDTLRPDHLGAHGYGRPTSPRIDALAREACLFEQAYTYWPKTRGSFVMMMTGLTPSQNGYSKKHPMLLGFNATLAEELKQAGYATAAVVDNPNVAAQHGYAQGFDSYRETWTEPALAAEADRTRAITEAGRAYLAAAPRDRPFFLWLHYVSPHAPYTPPPPFDRMFLDARAGAGPSLEAVDGFHGGVRREWAVAGRERLGYYVAQYDGEVAAVDREVGSVLDALAASGLRGRTLIVLTSDHGESLGEHDYYFDHGENLFDPNLRIPLIVAAPGAPGGRRTRTLASTLDVMPTILDAVKLPYPPGLAGRSLMPAATGDESAPPERLFAQNERNLSATLDERRKVVATPGGPGLAFALYDRREDPGETRELGARQPDALRVWRRDLELFLERSEREWRATGARVAGHPGESSPTAAACEQLRALGYVDHCP